jgi:Cytochrome P460
MTELMRDPLAPVQQKQKKETRTAVKPIAAVTILAAMALLAILGAAIPNAKGQDTDKYSLKSPDGIAFSDFRGYEDWPTVSSAHQAEVLKVIVASSTMIRAFKAGVPLNGKPFPDGSMIVKLQWSPKKDAEATFDVEVPDAFKQAFVMEKDSKRFPKTGGWGYAVFNYDAASNKFTPDPTSHADCGNSCHVAVKAKDYIFHPYQER